MKLNALIIICGACCLSTATAAEKMAQCPGLWMIDVTRTGDFCYQHSHQVALWRSDASEPQALLITNRKHQRKLRLRWPSKQNVLVWPNKQMPLLSNAAYLIQSGDNFSTLSVNQLPNTLKNYNDISAWFERQGCSSQLDLLQQMKNPDQVFQ